LSVVVAEAEVQQLIANVILSKAKDLSRKIMNRNCYYVYMMTNDSGTLYIGVTNDIVRRVYEHKQKLVAGFTSKYNITQLVYYEQTNDVHGAIAREKQIKGWLCKKKLALVSSGNPKWEDLGADWYKGEILRSRSE
jgi:putative endonuclease